MNGRRMQILRLLMAAGVFGCSVYSYVNAACKNDCRTAFNLTNVDGTVCLVFEDDGTKMATFHAYNGLTTYNQVNTEKQPANKTGKTINLYNPPCMRTCAATENPQEVQGMFDKIKFQFSTPQYKCAGGS